jgi:TolA-binding protein
MEFREIFKTVLIVLVCLAVGGFGGSYLYKKTAESAVESPAELAAAELQQEKQQLSVQIKQLVQQVDQLKQSQEEKERRILELQRQADDSKGQSDRQSELLKKAAADYRQRYCALVRKQAVGEKYETLSTLDHLVYQDVVLTRVDDSFVYFTHGKGAAKVSFEQLSDEWKQRFDYQPAPAVSGTASQAVAGHAD